MSIQSEITRINSAKADILAALSEKGVDTSGAGLSDIASLIAGIQAGGGGGNYVIGTITAASNSETLAIGEISDKDTASYPLKFGLCLCLEAEEAANKARALAFAVTYMYNGEVKSASYINKTKSFSSYGIYASKGKVYIGQYSGLDYPVILAGKTYLFVYEE